MGTTWAELPKRPSPLRDIITLSDSNRGEHAEARSAESRLSGASTECTSASVTTASSHPRSFDDVPPRPRLSPRRADQIDGPSRRATSLPGTRTLHHASEGIGSLESDQQLPGRDLQIESQSACCPPNRRGEPSDAPRVRQQTLSSTLARPHTERRRGQSFAEIMRAAIELVSDSENSFSDADDEVYPSGTLSAVSATSSQFADIVRELGVADSPSSDDGYRDEYCSPYPLSSPDR